MAIYVASITCSNSFEATVPAMETAMGSTMMQFSSQLSVLYVRLSSRSTSVSARLDPTENSLLSPISIRGSQSLNFASLDSPK
jgi:hypothetical protein